MSPTTQVMPDPAPSPSPSRSRRARRTVRSRIVAVLGLAVAASAAVAAGPVAHSQAVIDGPVVDPAPSWAAAVLGSGTLCSGALVAPNLVITAGHCDARTKVSVGGSKVYGPGSDVVGVTKVVPYAGADVALLVLDRSLSRETLAIGSDDPSRDPLSFVPFTVYGYGSTTLEGTGAGYLRSAVGEVTTCNPVYGTSAPVFCMRPEKSSIPYRGDSGSPLVAANHLMGIYTAVLRADGKTGSIGADWVAVSIPHRGVRQWVDDTAKQNPA